MTTDSDTDRLDAVDSEDAPGCPICDARGHECEHLALLFVPGEGLEEGLPTRTPRPSWRRSTRR